MGRTKRRENNVYTFERDESLGGKQDVFARVYTSMLYSPAYLSLTNRQRVLYLYIKLQFIGHRKPGTDYPEIQSLKGNDLFYFTFPDAEKTGNYTPNMRSDFYKDMKCLVEAGFIEVVAKGNRGKKSIYRYSGKWKEYRPKN
ncbi:hypothetical protein [Anaerotignum sp.]